MTLHELAFPSMGTGVRLLAADPARLPAARAAVERLAARLTTFDAASELCRLNADPRPVVPASPDLRAAVAAALRGAWLTGGLADPTTAQASWHRVSVGMDSIRRPPGVRLDLSGSAKGWIADRVAAMLGGRCAVDCGGDIRVRGRHPVEVRHPLTGALICALTLRNGAVATSGIDRRGHHVVDPATGRAAARGLRATALAPTAAEAEARAKAALLRGPAQLVHGGVMIGHDGAVTVVHAAGVTARGEAARADGVIARPRGVAAADGSVRTGSRRDRA